MKFKKSSDASFDDPNESKSMNNTQVQLLSSEIEPEFMKKKTPDIDERDFMGVK
jgi:hypothetical protein